MLMCVQIHTKLCTISPHIFHIAHVCDDKQLHLFSITSLSVFCSTLKIKERV